MLRASKCPTRFARVLFSLHTIVRASQKLRSKAALISIVLTRMNELVTVM